MLKKIVKMLWFDGEDKDFSLKEDVDVSFNLTFRNLLVGTLSFYDELWHFSYSEDFKSQNKILPLVNFPNVNKDYRSSQLWSFFASRIPSRAQRQMENEKDNDICVLLKEYGKSVVANPYILTPSSID